MESYLNDTIDIFFEEAENFENLTTLLKTPVGYNSYDDPFDEAMN